MLKFKLSDMASVAEVIGALAIVVSLIYVGIQVEDSTRAVRSATANEITATLTTWYREVGTDPEAGRIFLDGMTNPELLSREELFRFIFLAHSVMLEFQAAYYLAEEGTLDLELQESITNTLLAVKDQPGMALYWEQRGNLFQASFRNYYDALVASGAADNPMEQIYQPHETE
jgi:hypothetical protein